ncbi:MAG: hypothetical protein ACKO1O_04270, partial [Erythrobacter sp.]
FEAIRRDVRHAGVEVLDERSIPHATFPDWSMRYFDGRDIRKALRQMTVTAGGTLPGPIQNALSDFFVGAFVDADRFSLLSPPAAPPSSPIPC